MEDQIKLDYYHGDEPDKYCCVKFPQNLLTKKYFENLSLAAKVLYSLMLQMASYSRSNRWVDEENRVYIRYPVQRAMAYLNCGKDKALKVFAELDTENGIGLIERISQGQGKADLIYLKSFELPEDAEDTDRIKRLRKNNRRGTSGPSVQKLDPETVVGETDRSKKQTLFVSEEVVEKTDQSEKQTTVFLRRAGENTDRSEKQTFTCSAEVVGNIDRSDYPTSRGLDFRPQEVGKTDPNKKNINKNETVDTGLSRPIRLRMESRDEQTYEDKTEGTDLKQRYVSLLRDQVRYDELMADDRYRQDQEMIDGLINMIADIAAYPKPSGKEWINSREIPHQVAKSRLTKMDYDILTYAIDNLKENSTQVRNKRAYLLTTVYNAQDERQYSYNMKVNHDMYGGGWLEKRVIGS
jgi:hypothetical protein